MYCGAIGADQRRDLEQFEVSLDLRCYQEGDQLTLNSPNQILRNLPGLQARRIIDMAVSFSDKIPEDMYAEIVAHAK